MENLFVVFRVLALSTVSLASVADCDVEAGRKQFNKCIACHSVEPNVQLMGPSLHGLVGRRAGCMEGFTFSAAMEDANFEWTEETLSAFLENPMQYLPGTVMPFGGIKNAAQRHALVCYLKQLK